MATRIRRQTVSFLCLSACFLLLALLAWGCGSSGGSGGSDSPQPSTNLEISGVVRETSGDPVDGATVTIDLPGANMARSARAVPRLSRSSRSKLTRAAVANAARSAAASSTEKSTITDINGIYSFEGLDVPEDGRFILTFEKTGMATYQRVVTVATGVDVMVSNAEMKAVDHQSSITAVETTEIIIEQGDTAGKLGLTIAAGSLKTADGSQVVGDVNVEITLADPTSDADRGIFPGDYMARTSDGGPAGTTLESVAFAEITVRDKNGDEVTLIDENNPATVQMRLPDAYQEGGLYEGVYSAADDTLNQYGTPKNRVPWWSYNEDEGNWQLEDAFPLDPEEHMALVVVGDDGALYGEAQVLHFTWWNCDQPIEMHSYIEVQVKDDAGNVLQGVEVYASGVSYSGDSMRKTTDKNGKATLMVKRSTAETTETVKLYAIYGGFKYGGEEVSTPMDDAPDTGHVVTVAFEGTVSGSVLNDDDSPSAGVTVYTTLGPSISGIAGADGAYSIAVPIGYDFSLYVKGATVEGLPEQKYAAVKLTSEAKSASADFRFPPSGFTLALQYLEDEDAASANSVLKSMKDAGNLDANSKALYAMVTFLMIPEEAMSESNPLYIMLDKLDRRVVKTLVDSMNYTLLDIGDGSGVPVVDHFDSAQELLGKIKDAQAMLKGLGGVSFTVYIDTELIEVDDSDVKAFLAALYLAEATVEYSLAYDVDYKKYNIGLEGPGPDKQTPYNLQDLSFAPNAGTHLSNSKAAFFTFIDKLETAADAMRAETDDQSDDLLTLDPEGVELWSDIKQMMSEVKKSAASSGVEAIRISESGNKELSVVTEHDNGDISASYKRLVYYGYLKADLSVLFSTNTILDGEKFKQDLDAGRAVVYIDEQKKYYYDWLSGQKVFDRYVYHSDLTFDHDASHLADLTTGACPDVLFYDNCLDEAGQPKQSCNTEPDFPVSATKTGAVLVQMIGDRKEHLSLADAYISGENVETKTLTWTETVGRAVPEVFKTITIDGSLSDWGDNPGSVDLGNGLSIAMAKDASNVYLLLRSADIDTQQNYFNLYFGLSEEPSSNIQEHIDLNIFQEGGQAGGSISSWWYWTSLELDAAADDGGIEIAIPLSALDDIAKGKPMYIKWTTIYDGNNKKHWEAGDFVYNVPWENFWGFRINYK